MLNSPAGQASHQFRSPFSSLELENFLLRVGRTRHGMRRLSSPEMEAVRQFGSMLFDAVFAQDVRVCYRSSLDSARKQRVGLRIRLRLTDVPELADLPWEYLYSADIGSFLVLSAETPLVRSFDLPNSMQPLLVKPPLRILTMISNPSNYDALDVDREWANLTSALDGLLKRGMVDLERTPDATLLSLQRSLRRGEYHIFHFVGHGGFDQQTQDGVLLLEDSKGEGRPTSSQYIGTLLRDHRPLRLGVLNACEGARASRNDPFSGTAQNLIRQGLPAVIAMQFEITDTAAITFAQEFYSAIADSYPVDAALAEARKAIFGVENDVEWGTPVLYMRAPDGYIFDVAQISSTERQHMRVAALLSESRAAMDEKDWQEAAGRLRAVLAIEPQHEEATTMLRQVQQQTATTDEAATDADTATDKPAPDSQQQQQSHAAAMLNAVRGREGKNGGSRVSLGLIGTILGAVAIVLLGLFFLSGSAGGTVGQAPTETATATEATTTTPSQSTDTATPNSTDIPIVPPTAAPTEAPTDTTLPVISTPRPTVPDSPTPSPANTDTTVPTDTAEPTITPTPFAVALITAQRSRLRTEPRIANETSIGVACAGDRAQVFEERRVPEFVWYRIQITAITDEECSPERVAVGTTGWIAGFLVVLNPTPTPTPTHTNTPAPTNTSTPTPTPTTTPTPFATALVSEERSNMRTAPRIANETYVGVACTGDRAQVFEERQVQELLWYRVRITETGEDCSPERVEPDTEGWIAGFLVVLNPTPTAEAYPPP